MIVLDASVLVAYLDRDDDWHEDAEALIVASVDDAFGANLVTLAEVLAGPARAGRMEEVRPY